MKKFVIIICAWLGLPSCSSKPKLLWQAPLNGRPSDILMDQNNIYVSEENGRLSAFDKRSGKTLWSNTSQKGNLMKMTKDNNNIYCSTSSGLYCIDLLTGKERWKLSAYCSNAKPLLRDSLVFCPTNRGTVVGLHTNTGAQKWIFSTTGPTVGQMGDPIIANNTMYIGGVDSCAYAIDMATSAVKWKVHLQSPVYHIALSDTMAFVGAQDGNLYALDGQTGEKKWAFTSQKIDFMDINPIFHNGVVYAGGADKTLHAIDAQTGKEKWSYKTNGVIEDAPSIIGDKLYFTDRIFVHALELNTGKKIWNYQCKFGSSVHVSPLIAEHILYCTSDEIENNQVKGLVYASAIKE